jgi:hypothetical protein
MLIFNLSYNIIILEAWCTNSCMGGVPLPGQWSGLIWGHLTQSWLGLIGASHRGGSTGGWLWDCTDHQGAAPVLSLCILVVSEHHSNQSFGGLGFYIYTIGPVHENSCSGEGVPQPGLPPLTVQEPSGVGGDLAIRGRRCPHHTSAAATAGSASLSPALVTYASGWPWAAGRHYLVAVGIAIFEGVAVN